MKAYWRHWQARYFPTCVVCDRDQHSLYHHGLTDKHQTEHDFIPSVEKREAA